jgi:hypothetical protein
MTQLSLFETIGETTVFSPTLPKKGRTFFVEFYDEDMRNRLAWVRAKDAADADYKYRKQNPRHKISKVYESERDFDELESLD